MLMIQVSIIAPKTKVEKGYLYQFLSPVNNVFFQAFLTMKFDNPTLIIKRIANACNSIDILKNIQDGTQI